MIIRLPHRNLHTYITGYYQYFRLRTQYGTIDEVLANILKYLKNFSNQGLVDRPPWPTQRIILFTFAEFLLLKIFLIIKTHMIEAIYGIEV